METIADLLEDELKDLYSAENQLTKALPRMVKKATSEKLKAGMTRHLAETQEQIKRLEQVGEKLDIKLKGKVCMAMKGLVEEAKEILEEDGNDSVIDLALVGAARRVEHYEIAGYTTVISLAEKLGHTSVVGLLKKTLAEEMATDEKLFAIAASDVMPNAPLEEEAEEDE